MKITAAVERETNHSGQRRHGVVYPGFSRICWDGMESRDSENLETVCYRKLTIEDGEFENAYGRKSRYDKYVYTGQHTNLTIEIGVIVENAPRYVYGEIFHRNKYGSTKRRFRLDMLRAMVQVPKIIHGETRWYDFSPRRKID